MRRYDRVALVHDFLLSLRGAEQVFLALCDLFPTATLFSPVYDPGGTEGRFASRGVVSSYLNRLHPTAKSFRSLLPLYPRAVESLDLSDYDLIVSSSSAWAHGVITREGQRHLCYSHNPFRYAWDQREEAFKHRSAPARAALREVFGRWRAWDRAVAAEVDAYVANGATTQERIARCLGRSATVLHPPVDIGRFQPGTAGPRYVVLSELMPHKRIDVIVRAFAKRNLPLTVMGDGPDLARLRSLADGHTEFTGRISDREVAERLQSAAALVQCATEEFGIASVEAQAAGRPVLALAQGGALETVQRGRSGDFFDRPEVESLAAALERFDPSAFDPAACRASAERFSREAFAAGVAQRIEALEGIPAAPRERHRGRRRGLWRRAVP